MKIKTYAQQVYTPNQYAKKLVLDRGEGAFYHWREGIQGGDKLTEVQEEIIVGAIQAQWERVRRFLNLEPCAWCGKPPRRKGKATCSQQCDDDWDLHSK